MKKGVRHQFSERENWSQTPARYYDPAAGRWLTPDPLGYTDGMNRYLYVGNDPLNMVDPWGFMKEKNECWKSLAPFIIGYSQWHSDYNRAGEKFLEIIYKGQWYRFNRAGQLVEHTGAVIGKATGKAAQALKYLKNVRPNFFLRIPMMIFIIPPESKTDPASLFYDSESKGGEL